MTHPEPPPYVMIGVADLYRKVEEMLIEQRATRSDVQCLTTAVRSLENTSAAHDRRLDAEEAKPVVTPAAMWKALGVLAAILSAVVGSVTAVVALLVK